MFVRVEKKKQKTGKGIGDYITFSVKGNRAK